MTGTQFPEIPNLQILIQMIPTRWKRKFEIQFRANCANKTYDAIAQQLMEIGDEER